MAYNSLVRPQNNPQTEMKGDMMRWPVFFEVGEGKIFWGRGRGVGNWGEEGGKRWFTIGNPSVHPHTSVGSKLLS